MKIGHTHTKQVARPEENFKGSTVICSLNEHWPILSPAIGIDVPPLSECMLHLMVGGIQIAILLAYVWGDKRPEMAWENG